MVPFLMAVFTFIGKAVTISAQWLQRSGRIKLPAVRLRRAEIQAKTYKRLNYPRNALLSTPAALNITGSLRKDGLYNPHFDLSANLAAVGQGTNEIDNQLRTGRSG